MATEDRSRLQRAVALLVVFLWEARGDLLVLAGVALIAWCLGTIDWRLGVAPVGALLVLLGART